MDYETPPYENEMECPYCLSEQCEYCNYTGCISERELKEKIKWEKADFEKDEGC